MPVILFAKIRRFFGAIGFARSTSDNRAIANASRPSKPAQRPTGRPVAIQSLEGRRMFQVGHAGPLINEQVLGTDTLGTAVVLTFNTPLDPTTAENVNGYGIGRTVDETSGGNGFLDSNFGSTPSTSLVNLRIKFTSAVYDATNDTVTLTPATPFRTSRIFRFVHVFGTGPNAVKTATGEPIEGNGKPGTDALVRFFSFLGKQITYRDVDGDIVTLKLKGPGQINVIRRRTGSVEPIIFVTGTNPTTSILSGTVHKGRLGDGQAILQEVSGVSMVQDNLTTNPEFTSLLTGP